MEEQKLIVNSMYHNLDPPRRGKIHPSRGLMQQIDQA